MELVHRPAEGEPARTPVLFVHGAWHSAACWTRTFLPYFAARGHPAYALSLRGHGGTPAAKPLRRTRLRDYVEDVAEAAGRIGGSVVVVGHSMGGMIAQHYLARHGAAAGVLLASVPPRGAWGITARVAPHHPLAFLRAIATARLYPVVSSPKRSRRLMVSDRIPAEAWARFHAELGDESFAAYLDMLGLHLPRPAAVRAPVLVVGAGDDRMVSAAEVRATAKAYGARCEILPALSHDVMLDPEWRTAADVVLRWLAERGL